MWGRDDDIAVDGPVELAAMLGFTALSDDREEVLNVIVQASAWCVSRTCFASVSPLSGGCVYI